MFADLLEGVREAKHVMRGEVAPARVTEVTAGGAVVERDPEAFRVQMRTEADGRSA